MPSLWLLAYDGETIAGAMLGRQHIDRGWIDTLGVRRPWRRRGLAQALLQEAFHRFYAHGLTTIGLGVDSQNPFGASQLYERAGMRVEQAFDCYSITLGER